MNILFYQINGSINLNERQLKIPSKKFRLDLFTQQADKDIKVKLIIK